MTRPMAPSVYILAFCWLWFLPCPSPTPRPAPAPASRAAAEPKVVMVAPDARPRIIAFRLSKRVVYGGDTIDGEVETTSNVASVEARIASFSMPVPRVAIGRFALSYVVPRLPFFLHKTYALTVTARNARGERAERVVSITVR